MKDRNRRCNKIAHAQLRRFRHEHDESHPGTDSRFSLSERLAVVAGLAAAAASLVGFIPGVYRDRSTVVAQSHGYELGNLVAVVVLALGLVWSLRDSLRGRLVTIGALGCLVYDYVTYAFVIVFNPATLLYIAVLGLGGWSFATGLARIDPAEADTALAGRIARRTTAVFSIAAALLFALTWLSQIAQSIFSGKLPAELEAVRSRNSGSGHAAARSYSWISPPRRSCRTIRPTASGIGACWPLGVRWCSPWSGRASW